MDEIIESVLEKTGGKERSVRWFREKVKELGEFHQDNLFVRVGFLLVQPTDRMNFFMYSPKYKDDKNVLPYYDRFPLILPVQPLRPYTEGFMGLNFHYLSIPMRIRLLNIMSEYASDDKFDEGTRLRLTWNRIKRNQMVRPTIKRYLYEHVRTPFRVIMQMK